MLSYKQAYNMQEDYKMTRIKSQTNRDTRKKIYKFINSELNLTVTGFFLFISREKPLYMIGCLFKFCDLLNTFF